MPNPLSVYIAFAITVMVWSTTPLAIAWSNLAMHPSMAAFMRMAIAVLLGNIVLKSTGTRMPWDRSAIKVYMLALIGVYGGMLACYMSALYVPSGFMSVLFAFSPMVTGLLAHYFLEEKGFQPLQWLAIVLALTGLAIIFKDDLYLGTHSGRGIVLLAFAVLCFSGSTVLIKRTNTSVHPLAQAIGAMTLSLPCYLLSWWLLDGHTPQLSFSGKSLWAILYLATFGSLLGFFCFFYVLKHATAKTSMLVTLITPAFALLLGNLLNHEAVSVNVAFGAGCIMAALLLYIKARR